MDYSRKQRIMIALTTAALAATLSGCPAENTIDSNATQVQSADQLYREGRRIEDRVAGSDAEARANLQQARVVYIQALHASPSSKLDAYIRAGLANVAFYQDDYTTAVDQGTIAANRLDDPRQKSMALLRLGMAQQRLGHFDQADRTFMDLQQHFPVTDAARLSQTKYGVRQFYVQLAVFQQALLADKAIAQLRKEGFAPSRQPDAQGRQVLRVGPLGTYAEAQGVKLRLAAIYPGAIISP